MSVKSIVSKILSDKKYLVIIFATIGIIIIAFSYIMPKAEREVKETFSESEYVSDLENRVSKIVSKIEGAGECDVMININSTIESVYVKENKKSYDNDETKSRGETEDSVLTMTDENGNQSAVVTKQIMPQISGVTVVCDGGNSVYVQKSVIEAVSTLLDISSNKVCVIEKAK